MAHQVPWNKIILLEFILIGGLTETEEQILRTRVRGLSRKQQARILGMSISSIDKAILRMKIKYDKAQPYSSLLPERKFSSEETYSLLELYSF